MKKTTFVALLLLCSPCFAEDNLKDSLLSIESEWATTYYSTSKQNPGAAYSRLYDKTVKLAQEFPESAEPLIWEAIIKATNADHQDPVSALEAVHEARDLLLRAIEINPQAMDGAGYVTLGTLYFMTPKWPIAFGDDAAAKKMLQTALKINPDGIDANYYYASYLLANNKLEDAVKYLERALTAPARTGQLYSDNQLKEEAKLALEQTKEQKINRSKSLFASLFNSKSTR
ncbi:MAG: hypothetical protein PHG00_00600 [Methylococcales bacterium]|nr:hypothetical protein [Methylococcales bacterium]